MKRVQAWSRLLLAIISSTPSCARAIQPCAHRARGRGGEKNPPNTALSTFKTQAKGDRRAGVIWHTQGSGKSLLMVFYARQLAQHVAMANPTLVVLTDR